MILLLATAAPAFEWPGGDWHGENLTPGNYDTLTGTFTNVGLFAIGSGDTVFVTQEVPLVIYASTVTINGKLDAAGRGLPGGGGGDYNQPGANGFGAGLGAGGAAYKGGGGGGHADADLNGVSGGAGAGAGAGAGGQEYSSTGTISSPLSPDDISIGSGGGGGGGGSGADLTTSGAGGAGGGSIYIEARYITITGTVTAGGLNGGSGINPVNCTEIPGGGGGGSGGSILLKSLGTMTLDNSYLANNGGAGGYSFCGDAGGTPNPGGGGAAGRIKIVYRSASFAQTVISTAAGLGGIEFIGGNSGAAGSSGTVSYGIIASSPSGFSVTEVFTTSATFAWQAKAGAEWGGSVKYFPTLDVKQFRLYRSTDAVPFGDYYTSVSAAEGAVSTPEEGLTPDTTIYRMLTAYTDFGDSAPSAMITTVTFAAPPSGAVFPSAAVDSLAFAWSSGTLATGFNPAHTVYEISRSSVPGLAAEVSAAFTTGLSSAPAGLEPNTTYYFSLRAMGINGVYTSSTPVVSTPTLAAAPDSPSLDGVYTDSIAFSWSGAQNPPGTLFEAQLSMNDFITIYKTTTTLLTSVDFAGLEAGAIYSMRARAINHALRPTDFTMTLSTTVGQMGNLEAPLKPPPPSPTAPYSYDGSAVFNWSHPSGVIPWRYWFEIGSTPDGNDFLSSSFTATAPLTYAAANLLSGKTYYARVRAESAAGVLGEFSEPGPGIAVWISATQAPIAKPYNWPNPFDPAAGATSIGFYLKSEADVTIKIFTLQGIPVYAASGHEPSEGNKVWRWNGRNGEGRMVEPGGYICLITKKYSGKTEVQKFKLAVLY
ncbi:MAG: hypothetical protein A2021_00575 [Elusimicrobia bacterium GWF2_52_66]|nr:MAG: hypothetical protein A2X33_06210 [Elusimicrobia bacterium GWA2_51_34]OGR85222.1 MAG: hypothetical protein A2021_00575 [Elusimicrobia bacterium GWF2_52_66]HAF94738.1 hypothetical protein [Elusimicrobiota bacterium]HCE97652.1 hypothetical protein [Elusimicrobiota bacterium]